MPRDQGSVPGDHQVGFDVVGALLDRQEIAGQRVLGHVAAGTAMRYDKWTRLLAGGNGGHENCARDSACDVTPEWPATHRFGGTPMSTIIRISRVFALGVGMIAAGCASDPRPLVVGNPLSVPGTQDYCAVAQKEIASARVPARNVVMANYQA